jgi:hypothetical protein
MTLTEAAFTEIQRIKTKIREFITVLLIQETQKYLFLFLSSVFWYFSFAHGLIEERLWYLVLKVKSKFSHCYCKLELTVL